MAPKRGLGARGSASLAKIFAVRRLAQGLRIAVAVLVVALGAAAIVGVAFPDSWPAAQLDSVAVLATTQRTPVLAWAVRLMTLEPHSEETTVGGQPAVVVS